MKRQSSEAKARSRLLGPLVVNTGKHTARAANDKFVVRGARLRRPYLVGAVQPSLQRGEISTSCSAGCRDILQGRDVFVQDCFAGADPNYRLPVRIITEQRLAQHVRPQYVHHRQTNDEYRRHVPEFTVIAVPGFKAFPQIDGTPTNTVIAINFDQRLCIIGNSGYAGEIKKSVFTIMNYLLPLARRYDDALLGQCRQER